MLDTKRVMEFGADYIFIGNNLDRFLLNLEEELSIGVWNSFCVRYDQGAVSEIWASEKRNPSQDEIMYKIK